MAIDYESKINRISELTEMLKNAFQPMPGGPPQGGAPMDPAMMAQGGAPMDPAMMAQGGAPMDPAAMGGAPPPGGDPAQLEAMLSEVMSAIEQMAGAMEQQGQLVGQMQQQMQQMQQENMQIVSRMEMLDKALQDTTAPAPMEGLPAEAM